MRNVNDGKEIGSGHERSYQTFQVVHFCCNLQVEKKILRCMGSEEWCGECTSDLTMNYYYLACTNYT